MTVENESTTGNQVKNTGILKEYKLLQSLGWKLTGLITLGVITTFFILFMLMVLFLLPGDKSPTFMPGIIGGMSIIPIFSFGYAIKKEFL